MSMQIHLDDYDDDDEYVSSVNLDEDDSQKLQQPQRPVPNQVVEHFSPFQSPQVVSSCPSGIKVMLMVFASASAVFLLPETIRHSIEAMVPAQLKIVAGPLSMGALTVIIYALLNFMAGSY